METPAWYAEIERDESELDARINAQRTPRKPCPICGLSHRAVCPSNTATLPAGFLAPKCELCGARDWAVDHIGGDESEPRACPDCAYQNADVR